MESTLQQIRNLTSKAKTLEHAINTMIKDFGKENNVIMLINMKGDRSQEITVGVAVDLDKLR